MLRKRNLKKWRMKVGNELINKIDSDLEQKGECHSGKIGRFVRRLDRTIVFAEPMKRSEGKTIGEDLDDGYVIRNNDPDLDEWFPKGLFEFLYEPFKNAYHIKGINDNGRFY